MNWDDFDEFEPIIEQYMPGRGEGETMASQIATAVNKLIYGWYNDGDVYDNIHGLDGWANDLSSYANWLYNNVPESQIALNEIYDIESESEYEGLLYDLALMMNDELMERYDKKEKVGSIYKCNGPFEFSER